MTASDVVGIAVTLFALGIGFFVMHSVLNTTVDTMVANTSVINASTTASSMFQTVKDTSDRMDYFILAIFIGMILALIITAWFVGGNPIFMFVYFIVVILAVLLSMLMSNIWEDVSSASVFGTTISSFPITNHILGLLPFYITIVGFIGMVTMFAKPYLRGG